MAKVRKDDPLAPSVLDRLIDYDPDAKLEPAANRAQLLRDLKASVRRDVENLLNTRWRCVGWPADLDELDTSLANYGIPDFTGANLGSQGHRGDFVRIIQDTLRRFEPRLQKIHVHLQDNLDQEDRTMRFRIDAVLMAEPEPEPVVFDSALEPTSGSFSVFGESS